MGTQCGDSTLTTIPSSHHVVPYVVPTARIDIVIGIVTNSNIDNIGSYRPRNLFERCIEPSSSLCRLSDRIPTVGLLSYCD